MLSRCHNATAVIDASANPLQQHLRMSLPLLLRRLVDLREETVVVIVLAVLAERAAGTSLLLALAASATRRE